MRNLQVTGMVEPQRSQLEEHLRGTAAGKEDDFFNTMKFPTATFEITGSTRIEGDPDATHVIYGSLTMRDITKPVQFRAKLEKGDETVMVEVPSFELDRTEWGIKFQSKKFFDNLKDEFINDEFKVEFILHSKGKGSVLLSER
jgi:polyisoprenoid-binding protein YceI